MHDLTKTALSTEDLVRQLLINLGEDPNREGLIDTPARVAKAQKTLFSGYKQNPENIITVFDNEGYDEMVLFYLRASHAVLFWHGAHRLYSSR